MPSGVPDYRGIVCQVLDEYRAHKGGGHVRPGTMLCELVFPNEFAIIDALSGIEERSGIGFSEEVYEGAERLLQEAGPTTKVGALISYLKRNAPGTQNAAAPE